MALQHLSSAGPVTALPSNAAQETSGNLAAIKAKTDNLDLALTALRDALLGASAKTLTDVVNALSGLTVAISGSVAVTGPLTDTQLRAAAVPVSGPVTDAQLRASAITVNGSGVTQPVSAASLPLPTNAATAALQTQPGVDIGDVTINNATGAAAVNVQDGGNSLTVDGTVAITNANLDAALSTLATSANQTTGNGSLATIGTNTTTLVTAGGGGYVRQDSTATIAKESGGNLATLAGKDFATTAKQDTGNASLASIKADLDEIATDTDALAVVGGGVEAAALRVTLASDSTGVVSVDDNAGSLTVDALNLDVALSTVATAAAQTTGNASLATVAGAVLTQGATTIGQSGVLGLAAVNDGLPSYQDGQTQPLTVNPEGRLRVITAPSELPTLWDGIALFPDLMPTGDDFAAGWSHWNV